jgi:hypothetical protein
MDRLCIKNPERPVIIFCLDEIHKEKEKNVDLEGVLPKVSFT